MKFSGPTTLKRERPTTNVVLVGPGYDAAVRGIELRPGQTDTLSITTDGKALTYKTTTEQSPTFQLGVEQVGSSHAFSLSKNRVPAGGSFDMHVDTNAGQFNVNTLGGRRVGTYNLAIQRATPDGTQTFTHHNIALATGATSAVDYGAWQGSRQPITIKSVSASGTEHSRELANQTTKPRN